MDKPQFDPNKPFGVASADKPAFDPNQSFQAAGDAEPGLASKAWDATKSGFGYGLRALDYAGGIARTGLAQAANTVAGPEGAVGSEEWKRAFKGQAPNTGEYMQKLGVPEGPHIDLNPFAAGDSSLRDIAGFAGDVATDPLTYIGGGLAKLSKLRGAEVAGKSLALPGASKLATELPKAAEVGALEKYLNPVGQAMGRAGDNLYKSGFKTVDAKLAGKGIDPLSEVMLNNGRPSATAAGMSEKVQQLLDKKLAQRQAIYDAVNAEGGKVDLIEAMKPAVDEGKEILRVDPNAAGHVSGMEDWLLNYGRDGQHIPIELASDYKSRLYNATLPVNSYDPLARELAAPAAMKKQFARGLKEEIERTAELAIPGSGPQITSLNHDAGVMIAAQKKALPTEVLKSANKNAITSIDGGLIGNIVHNPVVGPLIYAGKKTADIANTTLGRTGLGNVTSAIGRSGAVDPLIRRSAIEYNQETPQSPWEMMSRRDK